jgi:hypothetical protein
MPGGIHPPPLVILNWPAPNYINPETHGYQLVVTSIVLGTLAVATVVARLYARVVLLGNPGWDDYLIVIALVCNWNLLKFCTKSSHRI